MDQETWFSGKEAADFNFKCEVIADEVGYKIAAKLKDIDLSKFKNIPKAFKEIIMEKEEEIKKVDDEVKNEEVVEEKVEETQAEVVEEAKAEEPKEEMVAKAEVDKRVSGMQSAMAKQMDAMKKDYEAKIADFEVQIKAKDEELTKTMALVTSLTDDLKNTSDELSKMTSAFKEKADALDALNGQVNTPKETTDWKSLKGQAFFDYVKSHPELSHRR